MDKDKPPSPSHTEQQYDHQYSRDTIHVITVRVIVNDVIDTTTVILIEALILIISVPSNTHAISTLVVTTVTAANAYTVCATCQATLECSHA